MATTTYTGKSGTDLVNEAVYTTVNVGAGDDIVYSTSMGATKKTITGGAGNDLLLADNSSNIYNVNLKTEGNDVIVGFSSDDALCFTGLTLNSAQNIVCSTKGNDLIITYDGVSTSSVTLKDFLIESPSDINVNLKFGNAIYTAEFTYNLSSYKFVNVIGTGIGSVENKVYYQPKDDNGNPTFVTLDEYSKTYGSTYATSLVTQQTGYTYETVTDSTGLVTSINEKNASGDITTSYKFMTSSNAYTGEYEKTVYGTNTKEVYEYSITGGLESYEKYTIMTFTSDEVASLAGTAFADGVNVEIPSFMSEGGSFAFKTTTTDGVTTTDYTVLQNTLLDGSTLDLGVACSVSSNILTIAITTEAGESTVPISTFTYNADGNLTSQLSYNYSGASISSIVYEVLTYNGDDVATKTVYESEGNLTSTKTVTTYSSTSESVVVSTATLSEAADAASDLTGASYVGEITFGYDVSSSQIGSSKTDTFTSDGLSAMVGGLGNDTYNVKNQTEINLVTEASSKGGIDTVKLASTYTGTASIENIEYVENLDASAVTASATSLELEGSLLANTITGGAGNDTLDGGAGNDKMAGGNGNDTYYVDNSKDVVVELANTKTNTLTGSADEVIITDYTYTGARGYTLANNVENLDVSGLSIDYGAYADYYNAYSEQIQNYLAATRAISINGNSSNNYITVGNDSAWMKVLGAAGDDTIHTEATDHNEYFDGEIGNDSLVGAGGNDTLLGGTGDDTLTGGAGNDLLDGGAGNDSLVGNGASTLKGGAGNDIYSISSTGDTIIDTAGIDTIKYGLAQNVNLLTDANGAYAKSIENIDASSFIGMANVTLTGNTLNNYIQGGNSNDSIIGGVGNDTLDGGTGTNVLNGGAGNDTFILNSSNDSIAETTESDSLAGAGVDTVILKYNTTYSLSDDFENLDASSVTIETSFAGNDAANIIYGSSTAASDIDGGAGNDKLYGGASFDDIDGGLGVDMLYGNDGNDLLDGGSKEVDGKFVSDGSADILTGGEGSDTYVIYDLKDKIVETGKTVGNIDTIELAATFDNDTKTTNTVTYKLNDKNIERLNALELASGASLSGNSSLSTTIMGSDYADTITGGSKADTLVGNGGADSLFGGNDALADSLVGGTGDDTYVVVDNQDIIIENSGENTGTDTIQLSSAFKSSAYELSTANIEILDASKVRKSMTLTGFTSSATTIIGGSSKDTINGGTASDSLVGGAGDDSIAGNGGADIIDAGAGNDTIILSGSETLISGGDGNDTYIVSNSNAFSHIDEDNTKLAGIDTIKISDSYLTNLIDISGVANVENLDASLLSTVTNITGNALDNIITGNSGNDIITGGAGNDKMIGGNGDDTYYVDNSKDVVVELANTKINTLTGNDTVYLTSDFTDNNAKTTQDVYALVSNVENLNASLVANTNGIKLTGNALDNTITGSGAADYIDGGVGNDTMLGGGGDDTMLGGVGSDSILGEAGNDTIDGGLGSDILYGGDGDDSIFGGNDTVRDDLYGGAGSDRFFVVDSADQIDGGADIDTVVLSSAYRLTTYNMTSTSEVEVLDASNVKKAMTLTGFTSSATTIIGGSGKDTITGGSEADLLIGGAGNDSLSGGAGDDTYIVDSSYDVIVEDSIEGSGTDTVSLTSTYTDNNSKTTTEVYTLAANVENVYASNVTIDKDTLGVNITGSDVANTITGSFGADYLDGGAGNDKLYGNEGADTILGGDGADTLIGGNGVDSLVGGADADTYVISDTLDVITDAEGSNILKLASDFTGTSLDMTAYNATSTFVTVDASDTAGGVTITGTTGAETIIGGAGADSLIGGAGADTLTGGYGADIFAFSGGDGKDLITETDPTDIISITDENITYDDIVFYKDSDSNLYIDYTDGTGTAMGTDVIKLASYADGTTISLADGKSIQVSEITSALSSSFTNTDAAAIMALDNDTINAQASTLATAWTT